MRTSATSFTTVLDSLSRSINLRANTVGDATLQVCYQDLPAYIDALENQLQMQGVSRDDCVAFECQNTTLALLVLLALFYRGQHLLLLPPEGNPTKEPGYKLDIPAFCKTHIKVADGETGAAQINQLLNIAPHTLFDAHTFARIASSQSERLLLLRTSGSTKDAKIVRFSHANLLANAANCTRRFELKGSSRVTITVPIFHMYGLGAGLIPAVLAGANINLQTNTNILRFLENERRFKPDIVYLTPTLAAMLLKGRRHRQAFTHTISAGAALPELLYQKYRERCGPLTNLYGSTEMGAIATTVAHLDDDQPNRLLPIPGVGIQIDADCHALHCLHPCGFDGYLNSRGDMLPVTTRPYNTGDVAQALDDGRIELLGRQSDSTNRNGFLVQFVDVENAMLRTGLVEQAVVLCGWQENIRGQTLYAFCIPKKGSVIPIITPQAIRQACFDQLPRYAVPDEIILKETFPLTPSGKINRPFLQQKIRKQQEVKP